ncbi:MAG TPA: hypothetical protein VK610_01050 [Rhodothermales bacterium]|nr:hypothetical protein [Rhodothermales bacterium]
MKPCTLNALSTLGTVLTWPWPLLVWLSFVTTCNQGDDESWGFTFLLCSALTLVALPALILSAQRERRRWLRLTVPFATVGPLVWGLDHALATGFGAHPLCGAEFAVLGDTAFGQWYYRVMWAYALALSLAAVWPWLARRRSTVETEPSDSR